MYYFDTTNFVDTRLWKTKHPRKHFQNFRQSCVLLTDRIEIHQSPPYSMTWRRLEGHTGGCNWWSLIRSVNNTKDWRKFWKRFRECFVFQSRVSTKTVVINKQVGSPGIGKTDSNLPKQYISMTLNKTISQHEIENRLTCSFATEYTYTEYVT